MSNILFNLVDIPVFIINYGKSENKKPGAMGSGFDKQ